jgi:hypothetical protein
MNLENFKKGLMEKLEKNSYKQELSYVDRNGETQTEIVYLKKSTFFLGDWNRIYPPINENGKLNLVNLIFGGKRNLAKLIFYLVIVALFFIAYREALTNYNNLSDIPCVKSCLFNLIK